MLAERATALGGLAQGTIRQAAKHSRLPELDHEVSECSQLLKAMADRYSSYGRMTRQAIEVTENAGDMVSSDLFIELSGLIDQQLWFIEAHLQ
jgi:starvation-inducible DNA-binding protein